MKKTKYDALFSLFALKAGRLADISKSAGMSASAARQKLAGFENEGIVSRKGSMYIPNKGSKKAWLIFDVMKFCRDRGINYNLFLSESMAKVAAIGLGKEETRISDFKGIDNRTLRQYATYLSRVNLMFVTSKKPLTMKFVKDPILEKLLGIYELKAPAKKTGGKAAAYPERYGETEKLLKEYRKLSSNISTVDAEEEQKLEFTSASTQLEGNTFTLEQAKDLIKKDIMPADKKISEAMEVRNYYSAVNYMLSHLNEPMSVQQVLDIHRMLIFSLGKEGIRTVNVSIQGNPFYKTAAPSEVLPLLDRLCKKINEFNSKKHTVKETVEFAAYVHNEFQHIHPFEDGNSRATRILWNYVLMKNSFPMINIYSNTREEYLALTKLARDRDDQKLNSFLATVIIDNLNKMIKKK